MIWTRDKKKSFHSRKNAIMFSKEHLKLQFWLWRKRQETGNLGRSRIKRRVIKNFYCSRPRTPLKTNGDMRIAKTEGSSQSSNVLSNGTSEKKVEMCKVSCSCLIHHDVPSKADVSDALNDSKRDQSRFSHNVMHTEVLQQHLSVDVTLAKENEELSIQIESPHETISKNIREFLYDFHRKYGSFIPLEKIDLSKHLKVKLQKDFKEYEVLILETTIEEMAKINTIPYFEVKYKKHTLTLDDLSTLASENWLNDQVINMYGELIMDLAHSKVHFLNSFFHRQLVTKGYEGVKRWTKQVDLFSKHLLLVPVHLEVHWCLVTADFVKKKVCLYDSQGLYLHKIAKNILKYLLNEAKEKKKNAFKEGWTVSLVEEIPQQTNENDCGVFVLEYSRCLAFSESLQFSQRDMPNIRKRIYKELCERNLRDKC
ncbi:sentrin-specific protease 5-like [Eucyclogobius newberryi]|uniref:sentrin-specific protease 5-like n=1 Tax=Eucyclogobius newberryi TaxID=166745 RepID=UPI003B599A59